MAVPPVGPVARIAALWRASAAHLGVRLDAPSLAAAHTAPGQFVLLRDPSSPDDAFPLALANTPGAPLELLVKLDSPAGARLAPLGVGAELALSGPAGRGYPLAEHAGKDLLVAAAGSGIAPLRAVLALVVAQRPRFGRVWLFYGQRRPDELAYVAEHAVWRAADVAVTCVISDGDAAWSGARGHVHHAIAQAAPPLAGAVAYVCGMPAMVAQVTAAASPLGLPPGAVYLNY